MVRPPSLILPAEIIVSGREPSRLTLGILAPMSGVMGVIGPSVINCACLAAEEASNRGNGRIVDLVLVDAGAPPGEVAAEIDALVSSDLLDGLVGCHTSDVRVDVSRVLRGRVPYVFTPPREFASGNNDSFLMGLAPDVQLLEPLRWMSEQRRLKKWALIGSDYVWPRHVHAAARHILSTLGVDVVLERLVPFGEVDVDSLAAEVANAGAQAILVSVVGRDGVRFHRDFAQTRGAETVFRLCTSLDENGLLAIDGDTSGNLFAAMPGFVLGDDDRHLQLLEAYQSRFGALAPLPGSYSEGSYDGVHLLTALHMGGQLASGPLSRVASRLLMSPAQRGVWASAPLGGPPRSLSLGRANGLDLEVISTFALA
ncbi:MAG: ABC transporter substrate-binding protein [Lacisediminihabitans sp.]